MKSFVVVAVGVMVVVVVASGLTHAQVVLKDSKSVFLHKKKKIVGSFCRTGEGFMLFHHGLKAQLTGCLPTCLPVCLPACLSACLSVWPPDS